MKLSACFVALALSILLPANLRAGEKVLRVSAASSLADVLKEIDAAFEKSSGVKVELNLGASSSLARQIEEGAPADVFFSADLAKMDALEKKGLIDSKTKEAQLSNTLVVVVPLDSKLRIQSGQDLTAPAMRKIALGDPKAVPAGVYAREWLEKAGLWEEVKGKVVATENVRAALAAVESGNVECGIVYRTDAAISKKVRIAYEVPAAEGPPIIYPMAAVKGAKNISAAGQYLDFLDTEKAREAFQKHGFIVLPEEAATPAR